MNSLCVTLKCLYLYIFMCWNLDGHGMRWTPIANLELKLVPVNPRSLNWMSYVSDGSLVQLCVSYPRWLICMKCYFQLCVRKPSCKAGAPSNRWKPMHPNLRRMLHYDTLHIKNVAYIDLIRSHCLHTTISSSEILLYWYCCSCGIIAVYHKSITPYQFSHTTILFFLQHIVIVNGM